MPTVSLIILSEAREGTMVVLFRSAWDSQIRGNEDKAEMG